jgi:cell division protein FtsQ
MSLFGGKFFGGKKQGASPARRAHKQQRRVATHAAAAPAMHLTQMPAMQLTQVKAPAPKRDAKVKRDSKPVQWRELPLKAMPVLAVALVLGLLLGGWKLLDYVGSVPVSRVAVTGSLLHTDRNLLVERVRPLLAGAGFMTVDLQRIRNAVLELPWVADVSIERHWPDQLIIAVTEQEAIARWGKDGLLNRTGEVFRPQPLGDVTQLPLLFGPDALSGEVISRYAELHDLLNEQKLALASFGTDERGSWSATLQNGVALRLGTGDVLKKMRSFSRVYRTELAPQLERIAYIDLRYGNGVAVGWKQAEPRARDNDNRANSNDNNILKPGVSGHG